MALIKYRIKQTPGYCGVPPFETTPDDPFYPCCIEHDAAYETLGCESTKEIDDKFLECCLKVAGEDKPHQLRARLYYSFCRAYGIARYLLCRFKVVEFHYERDDIRS